MDQDPDDVKWKSKSGGVGGGRLNKDEKLREVDPKTQQYQSNNAAKKNQPILMIGLNEFVFIIYVCLLLSVSFSVILFPAACLSFCLYVTLLLAALHRHRQPHEAVCAISNLDNGGG